MSTVYIVHQRLFLVHPLQLVHDAMNGLPGEIPVDFIDEGRIGTPKLAFIAQKPGRLHFWPFMYSEDFEKRRWVNQNAVEEIELLFEGRGGFGGQGFESGVERGTDGS
jgi:hypothetical protein